MIDKDQYHGFKCTLENYSLRQFIYYKIHLATCKGNTWDTQNETRRVFLIICLRFIKA